MELSRLALAAALLAACAATRTTVTLGALAAPEPYAAQEGARVLREGGNAADAAVCMGFVLAVTHPEAGNLGGGGFLVVHDARGDLVIDAREVAPAAATRDMYLEENGDPRPGASLVGPLAAGVPGSVAGYLLLHERLGSLDRARLLAPAIRLAREGFRVDEGLKASLARHREHLARFPETAAIFLPGGRPPKVGAVLRQPELARVLEAIARRGRKGFYEGAFALRLHAAMRANGGLVTAEDLANYRAVVREPLRRTWRGYDVLTMPPPSSGGVVLLQMLWMLDRGGYERMRPTQRRHFFAEVARRAFADRAHYFGDPDFVRVPVDELLDPAYLEKRLATIDIGRATPSSQVGGGLPLEESAETCHFTVADAGGNVVSCTTTLNGAFGCGFSVSGVLLNNEMDDFTVKPGVPNLFGLIQSARNAIEPGKRPLSSMTPTIVLREGRPVLALGSPGGPTIISTVCQVITNHLQLGMTLPEAVQAPRIHCQWLPDVLFHEPLPAEELRALRGLGHTLEERAAMGDVQAVGFDAQGRMTGVTDPRGRGARALWAPSRAE